MTILEVLLATLLSCLVSLVLFQMYYTQDRMYSLQSEISEMEQNLRVAIEKISRDLTMAGFAQPPWTSVNGEGEINFQGIRVTDGSVLDVVGSFDGFQGTLAKKAAVGATELELSSGEGENFQGRSKIDVNIGGRENARITNKGGNILTIDTDFYAVGLQGLQYEYPRGTPIYLVKRKTYWVDNSKPNEPLLRVDEHLGSGSQPLALFITGMEVSVAGRTAHISITGRTRNPDRTTGIYTVKQVTNKITLRNVP
jgi:hypothetical protein